MRISCNGCRVLRKACGDDCVISPCLGWITTPVSQSHATLFLAKFYGRTGLLNLLSSGPVNQRPAIFRSMLYEACGRIVDPVYGSVGLLQAGHWQLCQSAVDAVLRGDPVSPAASEAAAANNQTPYDIGHVSKDEGLVNPQGLAKLKKAARAPSKRICVNTKEAAIELGQDPLDATRSDSHSSSLSHQSDGADDVTGAEGGSKSVAVEIGEDSNEDGLELTLAVRPIKKRRRHNFGGGGGGMEHGIR